MQGLATLCSRLGILRMSCAITASRTRVCSTASRRMKIMAQTVCHVTFLPPPKTHVSLATTSHGSAVSWRHFLPETLQSSDQSMPVHRPDSGQDDDVTECPSSTVRPMDEHNVSLLDKASPACAPCLVLQQLTCCRSTLPNGSTRAPSLCTTSS